LPNALIRFLFFFWFYILNFQTKKKVKQTKIYQFTEFSWDLSAWLGESGFSSW
jgi:hypothetical protein